MYIYLINTHSVFLGLFTLRLPSHHLYIYTSLFSSLMQSTEHVQTSSEHSMSHDCSLYTCKSVAMTMHVACVFSYKLSLSILHCMGKWRGSGYDSKCRTCVVFLRGHVLHCVCIYVYMCMCVIVCL